MEQPNLDRVRERIGRKLAEDRRLVTHARQHHVARETEAQRVRRVALVVALILLAGVLALTWMVR